MFNIKKINIVYVIITISVFVTLAIWILSKWYYQDWFEQWQKYPAKTASLAATILMAWTLVLSTRISKLEDWLGGLDKVYKAHKWIGIFSVILILAHPFFLASRFLPNIWNFSSYLGWQPWSAYYQIGHNFGVAALGLMLLLISLSLIKQIPYKLWKASHQWLGFVFMLVIIHVLLVDADVAAYPLLRVWFYAWLLVGLGSFVYTKFLMRYLSPKYTYIVQDVEFCHGDVLEIWLQPKDKAMRHIPGQFAYFKVSNNPNISNLPHPFSIACAPQEDGRLKFGIKQLGSFTRSLRHLRHGDEVILYGPHGRFSEAFLRGDRDCVCIGSGIGITPFLGIWDFALNSEERDDSQQSGHWSKADSTKNWLSPSVHLYYLVKSGGEASFDNDFQAIAMLSQQNGFKPFQTRGHTYNLWTSDEQGFLNVQELEDKLGDLTNKNFMLCGAPAMTQSLIKQLQASGVKPSQIFLEDFNLRSVKLKFWK